MLFYGGSFVGTLRDHANSDTSWGLQAERRVSVNWLARISCNDVCATAPTLGFGHVRVTAYSGGALASKRINGGEIRALFERLLHTILKSRDIEAIVEASGVIIVLHLRLSSSQPPGD